MADFLNILPAASFILALPTAALFIAVLIWLLFEEIKTIIIEDYSNKNSLKVWGIVLAGDTGIVNFHIPNSFWRQILLRKIILREIFRHAGHARENLVKLYHHLGFEYIERRALSNVSLLVRIEALAILGYTGTLEDRLLLKDALEDSNDLIRLSSAISLIKLRAREYIPDLIKLLSGMPPLYGMRLVVPISELGDKVLAPTMEMLTKPLPSGVRRNLLSLAGQFQTIKVETLLINYAHNAEDELRIEAVKLLANFDSPDTAENLVMFLKDKQWEIRAQSAKALAFSSQETVLAPLACALADENYWVRLNSANALADFGQAGIDKLVDATVSPDRFASEIARQTLERLAMLPPEPPL